MSEKLLKILIYIAGFFCLYAFIAIRVPALYNFVLLEKVIPEYWENTKYGELYYNNNFIKQFREEGLPPHTEKYRHSDRHPSMEEADIYLFGDSFLDFTRMTTFPERLGDSLGMRAFYSRYELPLREFEEKGFKGPEEKKTLLYETAERYLYMRFSQPQQLHTPKNSRGKLRQAFADTRDFIFMDNTENLYLNMIARSYVSTGVFTELKPFKFNTFTIHKSRLHTKKWTRSRTGFQIGRTR